MTPPDPPANAFGAGTPQMLPPVSFGAIAHDLRQPLAGALHLGDLLATTDLEEPARQRAAEALRTQLVALERFAMDLADLERIIDGRWRPELTTVQLDAVVHAAAAGIGGDLIVDIGPGDARAVADPAMIARALDIVLARFDERRAGDTDTTVRIRVADAGIQVTVGDVHDAPSSDARSAALGATRQSLALHVATRLLELQGGHLWSDRAGNGYGIQLPRVHDPGDRGGQSAG